VKIIFSSLLVVLTSITISAQIKLYDVSNIKNKHLDIHYASKSEAQKLDIYLPDKGNGPFPVIVSVHGGAFKMGDKRDGQVFPMLEGLKRGYAVVSINYRLSGEAKWPAQIHDCKAAVRWIRANSKKYKFNPDKIGAWGGSAGGHLSAMLGTSGEVKSLEDLTQGNPSHSSRVQAVVDWFGPTDFLKMDEQLRESKVKNPQHHCIHDSPESELIGKNLENAPELVKETTPDGYITSDDAPFFIQHGLEDNLVPYQGSVILGRKLGQVLGFSKVSLELFAATSHGGDAFVTKENLNRIFSFLDTYLKD
jgi:acetyl esterase/lipase